MIHRLKKEILDIEISGIRKFNQLASNYTNVINLTVGEPNFNVDPAIKKATIQALEENKTFYTPIHGLPALRIGISNYLESKIDHTFDSENIIVTVGAQEALQIVLSTILEEKDEVILLTPNYPGYEPVISLNHGKCVFLDSLNGINNEILNQKITSHTKAILITSPNNPTGIVYTQEDFNILLETVKQNELFLIWDGVYLDLHYEDQESIHIPKELKDHFIFIGGFSKSHAMTGYRIGYLAASHEIRNHIVKTHQYTVTCASSLSQYAAIEALKTDNTAMILEYKKRRDYLQSRLTELNIPFIPAQGAFYLMLDISRFNTTSETFAVQLLTQQKVAVVPGKYFAGVYDQYIRISYSVSMEDLIEGMNRLEVYINTL